jgi:hypothetical protein
VVAEKRVYLVFVIYCTFILLASNKPSTILCVITGVIVNDSYSDDAENLCRRRKDFNSRITMSLNFFSPGAEIEYISLRASQISQQVALAIVAERVTPTSIVKKCRLQ